MNKPVVTDLIVDRPLSDNKTLTDQVDNYSIQDVITWEYPLYSFSSIGKLLNSQQAGAYILFVSEEDYANLMSDKAAMRVYYKDLLEPHVSYTERYYGAKGCILITPCGDPHRANILVKLKDYDKVTKIGQTVEFDDRIEFRPTLLSKIDFSNEVEHVTKIRK